MSGHSCRVCCGRIQTTETFIEKAKVVHNNFYTYEKVEYLSNSKKVIITCPLHGDYEQTPHSHLRGYSGCFECSKVNRSVCQVGSESVFIERAKNIHGAKYTYENLGFTAMTNKVTINCPVHGPFRQMPYAHVKGQGCRKCAPTSNGWTRASFTEKCLKNNKGKGILYILHCFNDTESFYKIGITSRSVEQRYNSKASMPYAYRIVDEIIGDPGYIFDLEKQLHKEHNEYKYEPLLAFDGSAKECFKQYNLIIYNKFF